MLLQELIRTHAQMRGSWSLNTGQTGNNDDFYFLYYCTTILMCITLTRFLIIVTKHSKKPRGTKGKKSKAANKIQHSAVVWVQRVLLFAAEEIGLICGTSNDVADVLHHSALRGSNAFPMFDESVKKMVHFVIRDMKLIKR